MPVVARVALAAVVLVLPVSAQQPPAAPEKYSQEAVVIERFSSHRSGEIDGTVQEDVDARIRVQSPAGVQQIGTLRFDYARETSSLEIRYVRVRKPDGVVVDTPITSAIDLPSDLTQQAPTFTDLYTRNVNIQALQVGDVVEYGTRLRERTLIPGELWFQDDFFRDSIVLDEELVVSLPASMNATVKSRELQPSVQVEDGRRIYTWHHQQLEALTQAETFAQGLRRRKQVPDVQVSTFKDWPQVGEAVRTMWRDRATVTPAIREKALQLTRPAMAPEEKVQAIYAFVSTNIRYVAVSFGIGRLQPHPAAEVLANGFGDCKDKHTLLVALLDAVDIQEIPR